MAEITRSQIGFKEDSYDSWDTGARKGILHRKVALPNNPQFPLSPVQFTDESRRDKRWFKHNNYPKLALELIVEGAVEYRMEDKSMIASAGDCSVIVPGTTVTMVNSGDQWRRKLCLIVDGLALESLLNAFGFRRCCIIQVPVPETLKKMFEEIARMMETSEISTVELSAAVYRVLGELSCYIIQENKLSSMQKVVKFMEGNLQRSIDMKELIAIAGCSEASLRRWFYREFKLAPFVFLKDLRLRRAVELLKFKNNISIKMLSYECGFSSVPSFIKAFRDYYGVTPGHWRKKNVNL